MRRIAALFILFGLMILAAGLILFPGSAARLPQTVSAAGEHGFDLADLDTTCKPCQEFFNYATGGWIKRNPIQPEYASWGFSLSMASIRLPVLSSACGTSPRALPAKNSLRARKRTL